MKKIILIASLFIMALAFGAESAYIEPEKELTVFEAMGIRGVSDINSGYVMSLEDQTAMELTDKQIISFCNNAGDMILKRKITKNPFCGVIIVFRTNDGEKTYFINSGVQVGKYGEDNYLCYSTTVENGAIGEIYASFMSCKNKYTHLNFTINDSYDYLIYPEEQWAVEDVLYGASNSILPYEILGSYGKAISREEFCILIANYLAVCGNYNSLEDYFYERDIAYLSNYFDDTYGRDDSINMLHALGIINGKSETKFGPGDALTREEAAVILKNAAVASGSDLNIGSVSFSDMKSVSKWATDAVKAVGSNGVMNGTDGKFSPKDFLTTEQAVAGINKLFKLG